jgi:hypothetical protein
VSLKAVRMMLVERAMRGGYRSGVADRQDLESLKR